MVEPTPAGWHADPYGRFELRFWDGGRWTDHVATAGVQAVDAPLPPPVATVPAPIVVPPSPSPPPRASRKVARQLRKAGVRADQVGGGTLFTEQVLVVNQKAKLVGSTSSYAIFSQDGRQLGAIQERRRSVGRALQDHRRGRGASTRGHWFSVVDLDERVLLELARPPKGWFAMRGRLAVHGPTGVPIGEIVLERSGVGGSIATAAHAGLTSLSAITMFGLGGLTGAVAGTALGPVQDRIDAAVEGLDKIGHARFGLEAGGERLASLHAETTREWDFRVEGPDGDELARITKTWAGWAKERFTNADNYVVRMHRPLDHPLRSLVVASALAIDVELKEYGSQTSGSSVLGTRRYD